MKIVPVDWDIRILGGSIWGSCRTSKKSEPCSGSMSWREER